MSANRHPNDALRSFAAFVAPTDAEVATARKHFQSIKARLIQSFGATRFVPIGSHARGTAIRAYSDLDMLAVLPRDEARWGRELVTPKTFLTRVAADLQDRFVSTDVRRDGQAVVLRFGGGAYPVDLVPGIFEDWIRKRPLYLIPGAGGQWISTSPETHDVIFNEANARSGGKLGHLAGLIKAWKHGRAPHIPLASFYTDMVLATTNLAAGPKSYGHCLLDFFGTLVTREVRGLRDPGGVAGTITASSTEAKLDQVFVAAQHAREHAHAAFEAERRRDHREALRQWSIVFNYDF